MRSGWVERGSEKSLLLLFGPGTGAIDGPAPAPGAGGMMPGEPERRVWRWIGYGGERLSGRSEWRRRNDEEDVELLLLLD